jgi:hypothetical protein
MDQATFADQTILGHQRERSQDPNPVRDCHLCFDRRRQERAQSQRFALYLSTDIAGFHLRKN